MEFVIYFLTFAIVDVVLIYSFFFFYNYTRNLQI